MVLPMDVKIKEKIFRANLDAKKLKSSNVAIVFGRTIYLHGVSRKDFLNSEHWVKHELKHVAQYRQYGFVAFIVMYLLEWMKNGYYNNRFEVEAREAENEL